MQSAETALINLCGPNWQTETVKKLTESFDLLNLWAVMDHTSFAHKPAIASQILAKPNVASNSDRSTRDSVINYLNNTHDEIDLKDKNTITRNLRTYCSALCEATAKDDLNYKILVNKSTETKDYLVEDAKISLEYRRYDILDCSKLLLQLDPGNAVIVESIMRKNKDAFDLNLTSLTSQILTNSFNGEYFSQLSYPIDFSKFSSVNDDDSEDNHNLDKDETTGTDNKDKDDDDSQLLSNETLRKISPKPERHDTADENDDEIFANTDIESYGQMQQALFLSKSISLNGTIFALIFKSNIFLFTHELTFTFDLCYYRTTFRCSFKIHEEKYEKLF